MPTTVGGKTKPRLPKSKKKNFVAPKNLNPKNVNARIQAQTPRTRAKATANQATKALYSV